MFCLNTLEVSSLSTLLHSTLSAYVIGQFVSLLIVDSLIDNDDESVDIVSQHIDCKFDASTITLPSHMLRM